MPDRASAAGLRRGISVLETGSVGLWKLLLCLGTAVNVVAGHVLLGVLLSVLLPCAGGAGGTASWALTDVCPGPAAWAGS